MNCFKVSSSKTGVRTLDQCYLSSGVFGCTEFLGENETECGIFKIDFHWIELLYSVVLVSSLQQSGSAIKYRYTYISSSLHFLVFLCSPLLLTFHRPEIYSFMCQILDQQEAH